jgi:hypothetical protein
MPRRLTGALTADAHMHQMHWLLRRTAGNILSPYVELQVVLKVRLPVAGRLAFQESSCRMAMGAQP